MDLATEFERRIRAPKLPGLTDSLSGEEFILPHYSGLSIANLPATLAGLLGRGLEGAEPPLPGDAWQALGEDVRCLVWVILDAVGYRSFRRLLDAGDTIWGRLAQEGTLVPLTSVFPSTTMAAMSSFWTGRAPGGHGFLGRKLFLSEFGVLADMIRLTLATRGRPGALLEWGWQPETFLPAPGLVRQLATQGVETVAHLYAPHLGSGLARLFLGDVRQVVGFLNASDMWINVRQTVAQRGEGPLLVNVYWSGTDDVAHRYGPHDERFQAALRQVARSFEADFWAPLPPAARQGVALIVTADHGQVRTPPERAVHLGQHPALKEMLLLPPAAEPRASYLYIRRGQAEALGAYVAEHLAEQFLLLDMERVVSAGLFGPTEMPAAFRARLGDALLLARDDSRLIAEGATAKGWGEHGSLRAGEMLVPLLMARLDG